MTASDTPETDAHKWTETNQSNAVVMADFARDLERRLRNAEEEAKELREKVRELEAGLALGEANCNDLYDDLREERDEAFRERDELAQWKQEQLTVESWWQRIDEFIRNHPDGVVGHSVADTALRFMRERDEALALIYAIEEIYTDGCDTVQDRKAMGGMAREFLEKLKGKEAV